MSTPTKTKRRGAPTKKTRKAALNLTITPDITTKVKKLAFQKGLSVSVYVEQLIRRDMEVAS